MSGYDWFVPEPIRADWQRVVDLPAWLRGAYRMYKADMTQETHTYGTAPEGCWDTFTGQCMCLACRENRRRSTKLSAEQRSIAQGRVALSMLTLDLADPKSEKDWNAYYQNHGLPAPPPAGMLTLRSLLDWLGQLPDQELLGQWVTHGDVEMEAELVICSDRFLPGTRIVLRSSGYSYLSFTGVNKFLGFHDLGLFYDCAARDPNNIHWRRLTVQELLGYGESALLAENALYKLIPDYDGLLPEDLPF